MGGRGGRARPGPREAEAQARAQGSRPGRPRGPPRPGPVLGTPPLWLPSWRSPVKQGGRKAAARSPRQGRRAGAGCFFSSETRSTRGRPGRSPSTWTSSGWPASGAAMAHPGREGRAGGLRGVGWPHCPSPHHLHSLVPSPRRRPHPGPRPAPWPGAWGQQRAHRSPVSPDVPATLGHFGPGYVFSSLGLSLPISQKKGVNRGCEVALVTAQGPLCHT